MNTPQNPESHIEPASKRKAGNILRFLLPLLVLIIFLLLWHFVSYLNLFPAYALPSPLTVLKSLREEIAAGRLGTDIIASLWRVAVGFVIASVLGIPFGLWLGQHLYSRQAFVPCLIFSGFFHHLHGYPLPYSGFTLAISQLSFSYSWLLFFPLQWLLCRQWLLSPVYISV